MAPGRHKPTSSDETAKQYASVFPLLKDEHFQAKVNFSQKYYILKKKKVTAEFMYSWDGTFQESVRREGNGLKQVLQQNAITHWGWGGGAGAGYSGRGSSTTPRESSFLPSLAHPVTRSEGRQLV